MINKLLEEKGMTKYRLSKESGVPQTTIIDICSGKTSIAKCSAETIYRISKTLGVAMEELVEPAVEERCSFELYKSNVCHRVKLLGDVEFVIETLERNDIRKYYQKKWYPECFYLLAMLDYLSRENKIPICNDYSDLRCKSLKKTIYPSSVIAMAAATKNEGIKKQAYRESIPEFIRFNIVESEVRNVI